MPEHTPALEQLVARRQRGRPRGTTAAAMKARNQQIYTDYKTSGASIDTLARQYDLSYYRMRMIIREQKKAHGELTIYADGTGI